MSSKPPQMRRGGGQIPVQQQQKQQKQEQKQKQKRRLQLVESPEDEEIMEAYRTEEEKEEEEKEDEEVVEVVEDVEDVEFDQEDDVEDKEEEKSGEENQDEQDQDDDDDENRNRNQNEGRGDEMHAHEKGLPKRDQESERMELLAKRLRPRPMMLRTYRVEDQEDPRQTPSWALVPHQVLHLHHMKTGGTSTDALLRCGLERMERLHQQEKQQQEEQAKEHEEGSTPTSHARSSRATERIPYNSIHECGYSRYVQCVTGKDPRCINRANSSSVMSFCAPLSDLALFGWVDTSLSPPSSTTTSISLSIIDAHDHHDHDDHGHENEGEDKYENQDDGHTGGEVDENEQDEKGGEGGGGKDTWLEGRDDDDNDEEDGETSMDEEPHYIDKITVMRHPVDRVWSMFRYTVRSCYQCRPLVDIYDDIDRGNDTSLSFICRAQLLNHQLANLMTTPNVAPQNLTDRHLEEAITNLYESITLLGMTSDMDATAEMLGRVWPWLAERLPPAAAETTEIETTTDTEGDGHQQVGGKTEKGKEDNHGNKRDDARSKVCAMTHANASPRNNGCGQKHGSNSSHWDLPSEPDEATRNAILRHNMLDMKLYEAGLERFELQKIILGMTTTTDLLEGEGRDANRDEVQNEEDKEGQ